MCSFLHQYYIDYPKYVTLNAQINFTLFDKVIGEVEVDANDLLNPSSLKDKLKLKNQ